MGIHTHRESFAGAGDRRVEQFVFTDDETNELPAGDACHERLLSCLPVETNGAPFFAYAVGSGMTGAGVFHGDLVVLDPQGPYRGGDLVAASDGGRLILRRLTIIHRIPHLMNDGSGHPDLRLALNTPFHGLVRAVVWLNCSRRLPPRPQVQYSRDGALLRTDSPIIPAMRRGITPRT